MQRENFIRRMVFVGFVNVLTSARGVFILPVLTRLMTVEIYGVYSQFIIFLQLLIPFVTLGLENSLLRYLAGERDRGVLREGFFSSLSLAWILAIVLSLSVLLCEDLIFSVFIGDKLSEEQFHALVLWLFPLLVAHAGSILVISYFRTMEKVKWYVGLSLADSFLYLFLAIYWVYRGYWISGILGALTLGRFLVVLIGLVSIVRSTGMGLPRFAFMRIYLKYCLPLIPGIFFYYLIQFSDRYFILFFYSLEEVGRYNAVYQFGGLITFIFAPFFQLVSPRVTTLWNQRRKDEAAEYVTRAIKYSMVPAVIVFFLIGVSPQKVMELSITSHFALDNSTLLMILAAYIFLMLRAFGKVILMLQERTQSILYVEGVAVVLNIILNLLFIPRMGSAGAALATLLTFICQLGIYTSMSKKILDYSYNMGALAKMVCCGLAVSFVLIRIPFPGLLGSLLIIGLGGLVYLGMLCSLRVFSKAELTMVYSALVLPVVRRISPKT